MSAADEPAQPQPEAPLLKLYVFGSCESDQYYHPRQDNESKRPICLTDLDQFVLEDEEEEAEPKRTVFSNPLRTAAISKIACGALHTVVSTVEGRVFTFGCNDEGALGREGPEKLPLQVKLGHVIDLISAGDNHSVFASSGAGAVYFTGNYKFMRGEKMDEPVKLPVHYDIATIANRSFPDSKLTKVVSGSNHSAILIANRVYIRGEPEAHTVGRRVNERNKVKNSLVFEGVGLANVEDLWCGGYHTIAKIRKGSSWAYQGWGLNKHGQLGLNHYDDCPYPVEIKKLRGKNIVDVATGTNFSVFLGEDGELLGCGQNDEGQLGLGEDYQFVDSEEEQEKALEAEIEQKMSIKEAEARPSNSELPQADQADKPQEKQEAEEEKDEEGQDKEQEEKEKKKGLQEENIYIKSLRKIPLEGKVEHLMAGSEFVYAWNEKEVYSWGFGMNYVLLNGEEDNETSPFKVKPKILNEHTIHQLAAGAQHVAYLSYPQGAAPVTRLTPAAQEAAINSRKKLTKRKRSPLPK